MIVLGGLLLRPLWPLFLFCFFLFLFFWEDGGCLTVAINTVVSCITSSTHIQYKNTSVNKHFYALQYSQTQIVFFFWKTINIQAKIFS